MSKKNILIINECFSDNLGDQAISRSMESLFSCDNINVIKCDYSGNKKNQDGCKSKKTPFNNFSLKSKLIEMLKKIELLRVLAWCAKNYRRMNLAAKNDISCCVIGGGQLILNNPTFPIALYLWTLILKRNNVDIHLFGVGVGDEYTRLNKLLISKSISRTSSIHVRDSQSSTTLKEVFGAKSVVIPDVAYAFPRTSEIITKDISVVGIVEYDIFKRYAKEVAQEKLSESDYLNLWCDRVIKHDLKNVYLLSTTYKDLHMASKLYSLLNGKVENVVLIDRLLSLDEYCSYLSRAEVVFSARMHSLILGERFGARIIPWNISNKIVSYQVEVKKRLEEARDPHHELLLVTAPLIKELTV